MGPLVVTADVRAGRVTCHVDIDAPREGRPATRVNWLVGQLRNAPGDVRVEAFAVHARGAGAAELLRDVRETPVLLISDPKRELRSFRVAHTTSLGVKRGRGRGSFIDSVLDEIQGFYGDVLQNLKAWAAAPPRMRELTPEDVEPPPLSSTALSSQDGAEVEQAPSDSGAAISAGQGSMG